MSENSQHSRPTIAGPAQTPVLEVVRGNERGRAFQLKAKLRLGRERDNDIALSDPRVSRYHARIELVGGQWVIRDEGSANGTFINGKRVVIQEALKPDDRITLGDTELVFQPTRPDSATPPVKAAEVERHPSPGADRVRHPGAPAARDASLRRSGRRWRAGIPAWGWAWLIGGILIIVVLVAATLWLRMQTPIEEEPHGASPVPVLQLPEGDFVLVYQDDFSDSRSGWDDAFDRERQYSAKQYGNGKYYIQVNTSGLTVWGLANQDVANFRLEVEASQEAGPNNNGYGVLFRFRDPDNYYRFDISGEGYFLLSKLSQGEIVKLAEWTPSPAIKVGRATNRLAVEALGDRIRLFANGVQLAEVRDSSFTHGNFGFFASTFSEPNLTVSFDNIKVWVPQGESLAMIPTATPTPVPTRTRVPTVTQTQVVDRMQTAMARPEGPTPFAPVVVEASPTPAPLPEYVSRDQPPARNAVRLSGRFYFPVFDVAAGSYDIYSAEPDGSDRRLVVKQASQPALSPDASHIAFRSWQPDKRGLIERALDGQDEWRFNQFFEAALPVYAAGGQFFLYHSREGGEIPAIYRTLGTDNQVLRREGTPIQGEAPAWAGDNRFVYRGCLGNDCGLILSQLEGGNPQRLTQDPSDTNPEVSPDSQLVAFMSRRDGNWDVYRVGIDGQGLKALTAAPGNDGLPVWSADGKTIAFVSDRDGVWAIWAMDADGGNQRQLFELGGALDGQVQIDIRNSRGWVEERIAWGK